MGPGGWHGLWHQTDLGLNPLPLAMSHCVTLSRLAGLFELHFSLNGTGCPCLLPLSAW